ncbi:MAG: radical SAM protein [Candidatus Hadarchaeales archaeon]
MVKVRVAFGTEVLLGLRMGRLEVAPTTAHFLTYFEGRCSAGCAFCPQGRNSLGDLNMLSRVLWPSHELEKVLPALKNREFKRVCIQAVNFPGFFEDVLTLVEKIKEVSSAPISISSPPVGKGEMRKLREAGVERLCIPLDAVTEKIFVNVKNGYRWDAHLSTLFSAREIFPGVTSHLIVGLGETEEEVAKLIQLLTDRKITVGLFAFTPIKGTPLEGRKPPELSVYRRVQLARYLIQERMVRVEEMEFENGKIKNFSLPPEELLRVVLTGTPFMTSGCPGCNRPFYNESPSGPIYNYPRPLSTEETKAIAKLLSISP